MTATLQYFLITVKVVALGKACFSDKRNPKDFVNTLTVDEKHYLLYRENLTQPSGIQLYQKERTFSKFFFFCFLDF